MRINLNATIIAFRERRLNDYVNAALRVCTFKGCMLGQADTDGHDFVAAFPSDSYTQRFLVAYYEGQAETDQLGYYVLDCRALKTER